MTTITTSIDFLFNLASSLGTRERPQLNYEFTRRITVNLK